MTKGWSQGFCESEIKDSDLTHKIDSIKLLQEIFKREHINALLNILIINALFGILKNKSKVSKGNFNYDHLAKLNT